METNHREEEVGQGSLFVQPKTSVQSVVKLRNLFTLGFDEIAKDVETLVGMNTDLIKDNQEMLAKNLALEDKHKTLLQKFNETLDAFEKFKNAGNTSPTDTVESVMTGDSTLNPKPSGVMFDPAIHQHKPSRPITLTDRNLILDAYKAVYKIDTEVKTLPDFFRYVNDNINATASKTEIEGVIYNRFDERLYLV